MTKRDDSILRMRRLPLVGTQNTRDLGGYPCKDGVTRWGVFLRSDSPHSMTPADTDALRRYGVKNTLDLRGEHECNIMPSVLAQTQDVCSFHVSLSDQLAAANYEGDTPGSMAGLYITILDDAMAELGRAMRILSRAEGGTLFHCMVGKDRTGVVAMLLLGLVGVSEGDIVADYTVTDVYMREIFGRHLQEMREQKIEMPEYRIRSLPVSMWRTLEHVDTAYGGYEGYLRKAGLTPEELSVIREKFVQPLP